MIPEFPTFKKLELSDRDAICAITDHFPPYSDYDFLSLWSWDTRESTEVAILNNNLVVRFGDYLSGELFYSFIGKNNVTDTALILLEHAESVGVKTALCLIPEAVAIELEQFRFDIEEDRDQFDYIYTLANHIPYLGSSLKNVRNSREAFYRRTPGHIPSILDLHSEKIKNEILVLLTKWQDGKGALGIENEPAALRRFLSTKYADDTLCIGIHYKGELVGFAIDTLLPNKFANCLFAKADVSLYGVYSVLMYENARILTSKDYQFLNFEQDLGLENLRNAKLAFEPTYFLKKYTVTLKKW